LLKIFTGLRETADFRGPAVRHGHVRAEGVKISPDARKAALDNARRAIGDIYTAKLAA
jgi:hypothetical protein